MKQIDKGYLAGIIDGEGMIRIEHYKRKPSIGTIRVVVTSTHEILPQMLVKMTQAGYYTRCKRKNDGRRIPSWQWFCLGRRAVSLLQKIRAQLIIKREQADWVLKFADHLKSRQNPKAKMSEADATFGRQCAERIRSLNSRERNKRLLRQYAIEQHDPWVLL